MYALGNGLYKGWDIPKTTLLCGDSLVSVGIDMPIYGLGHCLYKGCDICGSSGGQPKLKPVTAEVAKKWELFRGLYESPMIKNQLKDQLLMATEEATASTTMLLQTLLLYLERKLPWACKAVGYLMQRNVFSLFREVILTVKLNFEAK
ncbi:hypothetical protein J1N35_028230 [Gossypium stocksii]|uniref:Uncharacterized protein n=1 Tax=Gossypium stocksii TaxID=47602 RepID=A0A9D3UVS5_9ROSI|nr:hypothetical protein J1N35_028230 [Gossypium stocksii]